jgi:RimJ/RimL family protein N-acetyltransferase
MKRILETSRLIMREMELGDLDFIADLLGNSEVMEFWPKPYTRVEARQWLVKQQDRYLKDSFGYWLVLEKKANQPIGQAGLLRMTIEGKQEIGLGYIFHRPFWKKGFASEAASACIDHAFRNLNISKVIALVRPKNLASQRVAQKLNMMPVGLTDYAGFKHLIFVVEKRVVE